MTSHLLLKLRTSLSNWPAVLKRFQTIVKLGASGHARVEKSVIMTSNTSTPAHEIHIFQTGVASLLSASRHYMDANYHKVMINIQHLVFALCWFGMVGCQSNQCCHVELM